MLRSADFPEVVKHFAPEQVAATSCYLWSPVFPCRIGGVDAVIKRTSAPLWVGQTVMGWTQTLATQGIPVVTPLQLAVANPVQIGEEVWVAYPWIDGRPYNGSPDDLAAAGTLLGRMHTAVVPDVRMPPFRWPDRDDTAEAASIAEDVAGLTVTLTQHTPNIADTAVERLEVPLRRFKPTTLPSIRDANLPSMPVCMDCKANNLVYSHNQPVLIDPDNAENLPRILDLALAVLLFHYECPTAPGRLFTDTDWTLFRDAYLAVVNLTDTEIALWPTALEYMLCEWGVETIIDADTWDQPRQHTLLADLATIDLDRFPLT